MDGSGVWYAEHAWLGRPANRVLIEVEGGMIRAVTEKVPAPPPGAIRLEGTTIPGMANVHSHAFQHSMRGLTEFAAGDFWSWRREMYRAAESWTPATYLALGRRVFREMLHAGITAVGEFHYLHRYGNELGEALIEAAVAEGIRITLIDACYLRGGLDGRPLEGVQQTFSDGDATRWASRMDGLRERQGVRIGAAIHSIRAVDPASMRTVAEWARARGAPLHLHLAEQPAEVEECLAVMGCTPAALLERGGILGEDVTAIHAIHVDDGDIALLGSHKVSICACPTTERDLGDRVGPGRRLADAGCALCLGSDSNAVIDLLEEARGLELDQRRATGKRGLHDPKELLRAATSDGMKAIGWAGGELKPEMLADFVTVRPRSDQGGTLDAGYLVFCSSACDVTNVVVGGRTVVSQ